MFLRVAGPVWVGRPLLLLRATAALAALCTAPFVFNGDNGIGRFVFGPRSLIDTVILAFEAVWATVVCNDILLVLAPRRAPKAAVLSSWLVWLGIVSLDTFAPPQIDTSMEHRCVAVLMDLGYKCSRGTVSIGSVKRVIELVGVNTVALVVSYAVVRRPASVPRQIPYLVSAGAATFLSPGSDIWAMESAVAVMSGFFCFHIGATSHVVAIDVSPCHNSESRAAPPVSLLRTTSLRQKSVRFLLQLDPSPDAPSSTVATASDTIVVTSRGALWRARVKVLIGVAYLLSTVSGSLSYLELSNVNLANDLWWATFNSTGTHTFVANWFHRQLRAPPTSTPLRLDTPAFGDINDYASTNAAISYSGLYAKSVQYDLGREHLAEMLHGLRDMDGCRAPWIATIYCYADFDRTLEMASSLMRQARCRERYAANGAVYLESLLRNIDMKRFLSCWGDSFETGIAADARRLRPSWLTSLPSTPIPITDEVVHWQTRNITAYVTQWQNYKSIGLLSVFSVSNALGLAYDFTMQNEKGAFTLASATSWKMYWSFASDLWAISHNSSSGIAGLSLLRQSPRFAFANTTAQDVCISNTTLSAPLDMVYATFATSVGPFGVIDLWHVAPPMRLRELVADITDAITTILVRNTNDAQDQFASMTLISALTFVPTVIDKARYLSGGGNLLCGATQNPFNFTSRFTGGDVLCGTVNGEHASMNHMQMVFATIASGTALAPTSHVPMACGAEVLTPPGCYASVESATTFAATYVNVVALGTMRSHAIATQASVVASDVGIAQYLMDPVLYEAKLFFQPLFDVNEPSLHFVSWMLLHDWVTGTREVLRFQGDTGDYTIVSTGSPAIGIGASAIELPRNVATYLRTLCQYISSVLASLALTLCGYTLLNGLTTEPKNLFLINRVGALVWLGRPLLMVRAFTALCILCSATLQLRKIGGITIAVATRDDASPLLVVVLKVLASGELGWLVHIFEDIGMALTREYAAKYTKRTALLTWVLASALSFARPVEHSVHVQRVCMLVDMDLQLSCRSGVVHIGSPTRMRELIAMALSVSTCAYVVTRLRVPRPICNERDSHLMSCGAKYLFHKTNWVSETGVLHLDFASAALTGLLVWPLGDTRVLVFDVKTWRTLVVPRSVTLARHLARAVPLVE